MPSTHSFLGKRLSSVVGALLITGLATAAAAAGSSQVGSPIPALTFPGRPANGAVAGPHDVDMSRLPAVQPSSVKPLLPPYEMPLPGAQEKDGQAHNPAAPSGSPLPPPSLPAQQ
jgi:hypothetical protein